jgi:hypothetical protein
MNLHVDRLTLRLAGLSAADGRRLARLVGEGLAAATPPVGAGRIDSLRVTLAAPGDEALEATAQRIVAGIVRDLARAL